MSNHLLAPAAALILAGIVTSGCRAAEAASKQPPAEKTDLMGMFSEPAALVDQHGDPIVTRRAVGHPVAFDFNSDGKKDILLGCHKGMDTAKAEIIVLVNVGTKRAPRFRWPTAKSIRLEAKGRFSVSCGCKSGGTFEVHPVDWNGDGYFDLVVNTYWKSDGVRVLTNTGKSKTDPTFTRGPVLHRVGSHGKRSGGGDWTGDGVGDLVFPVNRHGWKVYPGVRGPGGQLTFADKPAMSSSKFKMIGQDGWFDYSPYAWNFSGTRPAGARQMEIIAVRDDPANKKRSYACKLSHLEFYVLDRRGRTVTRKGRLWTNRAALARMSIGDLNSDGSMDLLTTGGVFTRGQGTKIWVLYGKVPNVPAAPAPAGKAEPAATTRPGKGVSRADASRPFPAR